MLSMIPENKRNAVKLALVSTFGTESYDSIEQLTKGLSTALIFKITIGTRPYLLRVIIREDQMADPAHFFDSMTTAADAGLGPAIHYLSVEDRICITDFICEKPFSLREAREQIPTLLRKLHGLHSFRKRVSYFDVMGNFVKRFCESELLAKQQLLEIWDVYTKLVQVYPVDQAAGWVSSHNDLKPENLIYDGKRAWIIDWEAAFLNDRYLDLSVVGNFILDDEEQTDDFLAAYFQREASTYERSRFIVMQQLLHLYYAALLATLSSKNMPISLDTDGERFQSYHHKMWTGEISLHESKERLRYAAIHLKEFFRKQNDRVLQTAMTVLKSSKSIIK